MPYEAFQQAFRTKEVAESYLAGLEWGFNKHVVGIELMDTDSIE